MSDENILKMDKPNVSDFYWVKKASRPDKWELAYFIDYSDPEMRSKFVEAYGAGDYEGLNTTEIEDVIEWHEIKDPSEIVIMLEDQSRR